MRPESTVVAVRSFAELAGKGDVFVSAVLVTYHVVSREEKPQAVVATIIAHFEMDQVHVSPVTGGFELEGFFRGGG